MREAPDWFASVLRRTNTTGPKWQRFLADCPCVFSESLPLRLHLSEIHPLGCPGLGEFDFVFCPRQLQQVPHVHGAIDLKRPGTRTLVTPRETVLPLSRGARTALSQVQFYRSYSWVLSWSLSFG